MTECVCVCVVVLYYGANAKLLQVYYLNYIHLGYVRLDITFGPVPNLRNFSFKAQSTLACSIYIWPRLTSARGGGGSDCAFRQQFSYAEDAQVLGTPETEWNGSISMHLGKPKTFLIIGMHKWRGKFLFPFKVDSHEHVKDILAHPHTCFGLVHVCQFHKDAYTNSYTVPCMICLHAI